MTVTASAHAAMIAHARATSPLECCGLLGGTGDVIRAAILVVNEFDSPVAYRTEARSLFLATKSLRAAGMGELGVYHSHPTGRAVPSARDLAEWTYGDAACVIVGLGCDPPDVRAWRLGADSSLEIPLDIIPDDSVR